MIPPIYGYFFLLSVLVVIVELRDATSISTTVNVIIIIWTGNSASIGQTSTISIKDGIEHVEGRSILSREMGRPVYQTL
jgi:hypothetical protein